MDQKLLRGASDLLALVAGVALILMMLHIAADVALRWAFNTPLRATVEIVSTWYMVAVVFLPLALVERLDSHIAVELLSRHIPRRPRRWLAAAVALLSAAYFAAFAWQTWGDAVKKYAVGEVMLGTVAVTVWPTRFFVPVGCGLIALLLVSKAARLLAGDEAAPERGVEIEQRG